MRLNGDTLSFIISNSHRRDPQTVVIDYYAYKPFQVTTSDKSRSKAVSNFITSTNITNKIFSNELQMALSI